MILAPHDTTPEEREALSGMCCCCGHPLPVEPDDAAICGNCADDEAEFRAWQSYHEEDSYGH